jgi:hypothetical protein
MAMPAVQCFKAGRAGIFYPAVAESHLMPQPGTPDFKIV